MKFSYSLPFVAVTSALVLPSENFRDLEVRDNRRSPCLEKLLQEKDRAVENSKELFRPYYEEAAETTENVWSDIRHSFDEAYETASDEAEKFKDELFETSSDVKSWIESEADGLYDALDHHHKPGHGHDDPHHKPNLTVYQLIAGSEYTTKLAKLISEFDDLVEALNSTKGNYTVFAPTDKALEKIPKHAPKPSKEQLKQFLSYHVVPDFYPAKRVLFAQTAPTLLKSDSLGSEPLPQRLAFRKGLKGITLNFYSRIVAVNIFGTNGVIHGIDTPLFPPIGAIQEIDLFPGAFSTLELALSKTGLLDELNSTDHPGGTLFAPNNWAFQKLGPKVNAFLFSKYGLKYLKALLEYHVAPANTLYSDAFYKGSSDSEIDLEAASKLHVDLPTALEDRSLSVDIARYGPIVFINVNGFNRVAVNNAVAEDGVIHVMDQVIVPPKKLDNGEFEYDEGELSLEEFKERLEPYVGEDFKGDL